MNIKTIDIIALEWFDRINGNSYFAGTVTVNYGMKDCKVFKMPYQYGYGEHYKDMAFQLLQNEGLIPKSESGLRCWQYYADNNIIVRNVKHENCKKRELKNI